MPAAGYAYALFQKLGEEARSRLGMRLNKEGRCLRQAYAL